MKKYKILISGYYGFNNIGDESILKAVTDALRAGIDDIDITVLSKDPGDTAERYGVTAKDRKSVPAIVSALAKSDLLISGGGSLLQDVTSRRSILYYLAIIRLAYLLGKDVFIYSQGIGPINSERNRRLTAKYLARAKGIVVRDDYSKEFLCDLGLDPAAVTVTADPVLRLPPADLESGKKILLEEGHSAEDGYMSVGIAIKEKKTDSAFAGELTEACARLLSERKVKLVLIPFHFSEDMEIAFELERRLSERGFSDRVCSVKHKYLSEEMMSIIGNMDVLVGVRLHSLIHAAIMGVPMIGISYDPKVNSFMNSIGMRALSSIYDFRADDFMEEFDKLTAGSERIRAGMAERLAVLVKKLDRNEEMIREIRDEREKR